MSARDNSVPNIYKSIPEKFIKKYHNPHYEDHQLNHPFRMVIVGASGAGKTQLVCHILSKMKNTFSTRAKLPRSTKNETTKPAKGTVMYFEIPKRFPAAAIPANSAVIVPIFAITNASALNIPDRAPYFWRTNPIKP